MRIKLLRDIHENVKLSALGAVSDPGTLKVQVRRGLAYPFSKGTVHEFSEESAKKYIEAGAAEATQDECTPGRPAAAGEGKATLSASQADVAAPKN